MARTIIEHVQRTAPTRLSTPTLYTLPVERIRPLIRIAHRASGGLNVPERLIVDHELVLIISGHCRFNTRAGRMDLGPRHLLTIPPFTPHAFVSTGDCAHLAVHFDLGVELAAYATQPEHRAPYAVRIGDGLVLPLHRVLVAGDAIGCDLDALERAWRAGDALGRLSAHGLLTNILAALLRPLDRPTDDLEHVRLQLVTAMMRSRFAEPLTTNDLARAAELSYSRLARLFTAWSGYAPMDYLRRVRVDAARALLTEPQLTIKDIAGRCGFDDPYHFSRVFRRIDGLPPTQFRDAALAGRT